jgi:pilus assembly protein CpaB
MAVALFPDSSVSPSFIRLSAQPSAQAEMVGAVTRRSFVQGEPITTVGVIQPEGRGFLAAQLEPGYRAVAIEVERETIVGGYIQPNDNVDVIVTSRMRNSEGGGDQVTSTIVLENIRVLALGDRTQTQTTGQQPEVIEANVAVLAMTAEEARTLAMAEELGTITLALRGVQLETVGMTAPRSRAEALSQNSRSVRIHAYGRVVGGGQ